MTRRRRVAWIATHPIQYQVPVFKCLAQFPELEFTVLYLSPHMMGPGYDPGFGRSMAWDVPLLEGYDWVLLSDRRPDFSRFTGIRAPLLWPKKAARAYDVSIASGWNYLGFWQALGRARAQGTICGVLSESTLTDVPRVAWREKAKTYMLRALAGGGFALATGTRSREYLRHLGFPDDRLFLYPYCVDDSLFRACETERAELRSASRRSLGLDGETMVFIFAGKLVSKKNPVGALEAYLGVPGKKHLLVVGDGELRDVMERLAAARQDVTFLGFRNQTEMRGLYAAADILILPSVTAETWGLVVNEAMAMGCGVIVSDAVGSADDLVAGKGTGAVVPAGDLESLRHAMAAAVGERERTESWKRRAVEVVAPWTPIRAAEGVRAAVLATGG